MRGELNTANTLHSLIVDSAKELKTWLNFKLWLVGLDNRADDRNIYVLGADIVRRRHHGDVDVY